MSVAQTILKGWPTVIEMGRVLPGPPEVVWHLITDWENQDLWMLEARDFVVTSEHREGLGVEGRATVSIGGITTTDTVVVTGWELNKRLAIEHKGWVSGKAEMRLTELEEGGTHIIWQEKLFPPLGILGAIGLFFFKPLMKRIFERDLRVLDDLTLAEVTNRG
jgi:uncharacterized protein YndB with AHSA1/START domain